MTTSDLALIALGILAQVATFAVGVGVGRTISRRETDHDDSDSDTEEQPTRWRVYDRDRNTAAGNQRRGGSGADATGEAGAGERAPGWWGTDGD